VGTNVIDAFFVTLGLDSSAFQKNVSEVGDLSKKTSERTKKAFTGIEDQGKELGQAFRTVRNEAIGLFLAMSGASSITNFITGMLTSSATADRFGQTVGMATGRVVAWRQAMKEIGGSAGSADAGLGVIEKAMQSFRLTGTSGIDADLIGLGVNRSDLMNKDPGQILQKIAQARGHMTGPEFGNRLQRIGMPQDMVFFLQQGGDRVKELIAHYEKNAKQYEQQAKAAENLQKSMAELSATIANKLVPPVTKIAEFLAQMIEAGDNSTARGKAEQKIFGGPDWLYKPLWGGPPSKTPSSGSHWWNKVEDWWNSHFGSDGAGASNNTRPKGGGGPSLADRNRNPGNIRDGAFARRQPGYIGQAQGFAKFDTAGHGAMAMFRLIESYVASGHKTIASIVAKWAPPSENNTGAYVADVEKQTGIGRHQALTNQQLAAVARAIAKHEGYHGAPVNIGHITVHTQATDAHGVARGIHHALKKRGIVARADGGVAP
jgi:hypothetical protein